MLRYRCVLTDTPSACTHTHIQSHGLTVQDVFVDYSLPLEVRYLAIIQLKNGIDKYWRKTAPK